MTQLVQLVGGPGRIRSRALMRAACLLVAFASSGCMATLDGGPARLYTISDEVTQARLRLEGVAPGPDQEAIPGLVQRYYAIRGATRDADDERRFFRNEIIARRMYIIDIQYSEYEASLTRDRQTVGFLTSTTNQGLTIASTLAASQSAARVLSGVAGGVGAVKGIYDSEILVAKSIQIIQGQMRGQRDIVAHRILGRLNWTATAYPLSAAMMDLEDYYRAGTLNTGLLNAARDAGEIALRSGELRGNAVVLRVGNFVPTEETSRILQAFLAGSAAAEGQAQACLNELGMPRDALGRPFAVDIILTGSNEISTRQRVINCLKRKKQLA